MMSSDWFEKDGAYYFWDETGTDYIGPYDTEEECKQGLKRYEKCLDKSSFSEFKPF